MSQLQIGAFWVILWTADLVLAALIIRMCEKNANKTDKFIDKLDARLDRFIAFCKQIKEKDTIKKISA